jgi:putative transposase
MSVFSLTIGLIVRNGLRTWRLERQIEGGTLVFADCLTGMPKTLTVSQLWADLGAGRLQIVVGNRAEPGAAAPQALITDWKTLPDRFRSEVERRLKYIRAAQAACVTRGMRGAIERLVAKVAPVIPDPSPPTASTVMLWMRRLDAADGSPAVLIPGEHNRRQPPRKPGPVLEVARNALKDVYCTRARPSLSRTKILIDRQLEQLAASGAVPADKASISKTTLRRLRDEIEPYHLNLSRYGSDHARNGWRYSLSGPDVTRAMQRYEIDHTLIDLVVICDRSGLPLGRPIITVVVDAYSSYVVGFFISFWGTSLGSALSALKVALSPKGEYTEGVSLSQPWLGMGVPELLVMDNGLEFHSPQFRLVALELAFDLLYCAVRQPWLKPHVERCLGSYLSHLPSAGRVRKALANELPLRPDKTACITFSSLCQGLLKAFAEVHALQINQRKLARPIDLFQESLDRLPPPALPADPNFLEIVAAESKTLTIGNEGVLSSYLRFNSTELQALRRATGKTFQTLVKINPADLGQVYVQDPKTKGWLLVPSCFPEYTDGLSITQHRAIRQNAKDRLTAKNAEAELLRSRAELIDYFDSCISRGKKLKSSTLKALGGLTSSHVLRKEHQAGLPTGKPASRLEVLTKEEMQPEASATPSFEAFTF